MELRACRAQIGQLCADFRRLWHAPSTAHNGGYFASVVPTIGDERDCQSQLRPNGLASRQRSDHPQRTARHAPCIPSRTSPPVNPSCQAEPARQAAKLRSQKIS
jgi:hypothetical protein